MASINVDKFSAALALADMVATLLGKKLISGKVTKIFGKSPEVVDAYISGCDKLQAAADAGLGLGPLTAEEVRAISKVDDTLVKAAKKVKSRLPKLV